MRPEQALRLGVGSDTEPEDVLEVASLGDDGTVNLWYGNVLVPGVPALRSYTNRAVGDIVRVSKSRLGWRVTGPSGAPTDDTVTWASIKGKPADIPGSTAPPDPDPVTPASRALYQNGHVSTYWNGGQPAQGSYGSYPANTGAFFYGSKVTAAVGAKTVAGMQVRLSRQSSGGLPGPVQVHLYLLTPSSAPFSTPALTQLANVGSLTFNQSRFFDLPAGHVSALASGAAGGLAVSAGRGQDYILLKVCGDLLITYSA